MRKLQRFSKSKRHGNEIINYSLIRFYASPRGWHRVQVLLNTLYITVRCRARDQKFADIPRRDILSRKPSPLRFARFGRIFATDNFRRTHENLASTAPNFDYLVNLTKLRGESQERAISKEFEKEVAPGLRGLSPTFLSSRENCVS